ncbi:MAG TPA: hypothetical protein VFI65_16570 [Streptosporangiaceae bacterium]|nr:hypothetical protein [Streptosporangiaceae bacterium]
MMRFQALASLRELDPSEFDRLDATCGPAGCHSRLLQLERDRRWSTEYLCAREGGTLLAAVPLYRLKKGAWPDPSYDPATWGLETPPPPADATTVVGGRSGLLSTLHLASEIIGSRRHVRLIEELLVREPRRSLLLPFLTESQLRPWKEVLGSRLAHEPLGSDARFDRPLAGAPLPRSVRKTLNADQRMAESLGIESAVSTWSEVRSFAAGLIAEGNRAHGLPDAEQLVDFRIRQWEACEGASVVVLTAKAHGEHGLTVGVIWRNWMDLQEMGLTGVPGDLRRSLYAQLLFHLPIRFARQLGGVRHIRAGLKAEQPKAIRGASFVPLNGGTFSVSERQQSRGVT